MYNVHQLNVFTTAAETLNFTTAAKILHMTQSSVSQHIKNLETQLETDLFARRGRNLELTDAGRYFLPLARSIIDDIIRAQEKMQMLKDRVHGQLIIGCNTAPGKYVLPLMLTEFHRQHPLVEIACTVVPQTQMLEHLRNGDIHFALLTIDARDAVDADHHLYICEPINLIAPLNHPWAMRDSIEPEELYDGTYIMREPSSGSYASLQQALSRVGVDLTRLPVALTMGTSEAIALAVQQNLGVGFVARTIVDKISAGRVATVPIDGVEIAQDIYIARQTRNPASPAQTAFWDFIRDSEGERYQQPELVPALDR